MAREEYNGLQYEGTVIRPPSEADSLILQVTLGCSDNACIFCPAYKDKPYRVKSFVQIEQEIRAAAQLLPGTRKVFLADGDAVGAGQEHLERIMELLDLCFPHLARISAYGSIKSLAGKTVTDLRELKRRKLSTLYLGFETGDDEVYRSIRKHGSPLQNIEACLKVKDAGIKTNVTVILGLGGKEHTRSHAVHTAAMLNKARPDQIAALTLMVAPHTPLFSLVSAGAFRQLDTFEYLEELRTLIASLEDFRCLFFANHASNYFPVNARFPKDKLRVLSDLEAVLRCHNPAALSPEYLRGL